MGRLRLKSRAAALAGTAVIAVAAAVTPTVTTGTAAAAVADPSAAGDDWLHTDGNRIVDAEGNPVWLTGANWFGFNATERVFHGLWSANLEDVTASMAERGINIVRVPISTELIKEWQNGQDEIPSGLNTYANPELEGLTTLGVFDAFLGLSEQYGLKVMLDVHSAKADNSGHFEPMWWKDDITVEDFYSAWEWIADRYKNDDTLVAMDIENEPHGTHQDDPRAKWDGSTDQDNWKHACETAGQRILDINPRVLILCEGIEVYPRDGAGWESTDEDDYHFNWWGGNLRGVADHPVDLGAQQDQLVYSPHDYGPLVHQQPWFEGDWNRRTLEEDIWDPNWLYIHKENTAPLLVGEWGGRLDGGDNEKWMTALRDMMTDYGIHHTFWCINPNSGDTGGLLGYDWQTWDEEKYALLKPALWQHEGRFVGLDHEVPLGGEGSTTGLSVSDVYGGGNPPEEDTEAPSVPDGLQATEVGDSSVSLSWNPSTDNEAVTGYTVYRNGTEAGTSLSASFTDTGLEADASYAYSVLARDGSGNASALSAELTVTTTGGGGDDGGDDGGDGEQPGGSVLSDGANTWASSGYSTGGSPAYAVDGDAGTAWVSGTEAGPWIVVDLGGRHDLTGAVIDWDDPYAPGFRIQTSNDAGNWTDVHTVTGGSGGTQSVTFDGDAQFVRLVGDESSTGGGIAVSELEIYGE